MSPEEQLDRARAEIERRLNRYDDIALAASRLANEVLGSLPLMEKQSRRDMGNTNYNLLIQRALELRAILAPLPSAKMSATVPSP